MKLRAALGAVLLLTMLAGCPSTSRSPVDSDRVAVMKADPAIAHDSAPSVTVGSARSASGPPRRSEVVSSLATTNNSPGAFADARQLSAEAMKAMRATGWTVYFASCEHPSEREWLFHAFGYKIADGVSYHVALYGRGSTNDNQAATSLTLRAPFSGEPSADLFPDRPAAADASNCIESGPQPTASASTGTNIIVDPDGPDPDGKPAKDPGHR